MTLREDETEDALMSHDLDRYGEVLVIDRGKVYLTSEERGEKGVTSEEESEEWEERERE